ncbi:hypothetical protein WJX75_008444 [Coccomyxa subellipsoidea]|uniref:V-ATPase proteolipid subunit C-like domain-containing protein n=1 Tax=Coccomyxa subellipsoidea TaxID=248742 RepID=A0ABR2YJU0_9CHLO
MTSSLERVQRPRSLIAISTQLLITHTGIQALPRKLEMSSQYINISLSLVGLVALAGAGVAVGSGVGMMALAMAEEEQKQQGTSAVAHSVIEKKPTPGSGRGFAASNQ